MTQRAQGRKLAILATDGFEQVELTSPKEAIENAGGETVIVSINHGTIQANKHREGGRLRRPAHSRRPVQPGRPAHQPESQGFRVRLLRAEEARFLDLPRSASADLGQSRQWP